MAYVMTDQEVKDYSAFLRACESRRCELVVQFETTREFAEYVLPPCLDVPEAPVCTVYAGNSREFWNGRAIRGDVGEEIVAGVSINTAYQGDPGSYGLTAIRDGDMSITVGRECWGVAKKRGDGKIFDAGDLMYAYGEREGTRVIEIETSLVPALPPFDFATQGRSYHLKGQLDALAGGDRLQDDPVLLTLGGPVETTSARIGDPAKTWFKLTGTPNDPLDTIPIGDIVRVYFRTFRSVSGITDQVRLTDHATYLPYLLGKGWDNPTIPANLGEYAVE